MSEEVVQDTKKGGKGKLAIIIAVAVIVIGGIIGYFAFAGSAGSDKAKYFKAEADTLEFLTDEWKERYAEELEWAEGSKENAEESSIDITAEYNDPNAYGGVSEAEEIINNSKVSLLLQSDIQEKLLYGDISADVMGMTFDDFKFGVDANQLLFDLPFLDDVILIDGDNIGELLSQVDPYTFDEDMSFDFEDAFDIDNYPISEEDQEYLKDKYSMFLFDEISDDSFESETEDITVEGQDISAEKIALHLSEEEVRDLVTALAKEMQGDDRLKEIIESYLKSNFMAATDINMVMDEFEDGLEQAQENIDDLNVPDGITSEIWIDDGLIAQRDFHMAVVDDFDEKAEFSIVGTQLLEDDKQTFDYTLNVVDEYTDEEIFFTGSLAFDGETVNDELVLSLDLGDVTYAAEETINKGEKTFDRSLSIASPFINGGLFWSGDSTFEKDQMSGNHKFHVEAEGLGEDILNIQAVVEGKRINEVETINTDSVKDVGTMSEEEISNYIEGEAAEQFFEWYMEKFGGF